MPGWKRVLGKPIDNLVAAVVPVAPKKVRRNQPFDALTHLHNGASLDLAPPKTSGHPEVRCLGIHKHDDLDVAAAGSWFEQRQRYLNIKVEWADC